MEPPILVNISHLHRQTAEVVRQAEASDRPVFVTQFAHVAAVLLPRKTYDRLLRAAEASAAQGTPRHSCTDAGEVEYGPEGDPEAQGTPRSPLESPLAVFGPLPRGTRFMTRQGYSVDPEMVAWLMEEGEEVRPILVRWGDEEEGDGESSERMAWR